MDFENIKPGLNNSFDHTSANLNQTVNETEEEHNIFDKNISKDGSQNVHSLQQFYPEYQNWNNLTIKDFFSNINEKINEITDRMYAILNKSIINGSKNILLNISVGRLFELCQIPNIENKFDDINLHKNGERLDKSLEDWTLKAGDKEVKILTDNNIVSEEWVKNTKEIPKNGGVLTSDAKITIEEAIKTLNESGQKIPNEIYITNIWKNKNTAGYFSTVNPNSIFIRADQLQNINYLKHIIYHEAAHMSDWQNSRVENEFLSNTKNIDISPIIQYGKHIKLPNINGKEIYIEELSNFISSEAKSNPKKLKEEINFMIDNGIITRDNDGKYTINFGEDNYVRTADGHEYIVFFDDNLSLDKKVLSAKYPKAEFFYTDSVETINELLNNTMELYNYVKENNITEYETKQECIEFNNKKIAKEDIENIISDYSLTNNNEFIAEVSALLRIGTITQTKESKYTINTDNKGHYRNAKKYDCFVTDKYNKREMRDYYYTNIKLLGNKEDVDKKLNDIMELYNYMTDGKIK